MEAPRDDLIRASRPGLEFRDDAADDSIGYMHGHFVVFNQWTEIASWYEGDFMERVAPGSAKKTINENFEQIRCLYDHGHDMQIGNKILGPFDELKEDKTGVRYGVPLFDTSYNRDLLPGLKAGAYGSSFRFRVIRDEWNDEPGTSSHNPKGLPERTIKEFSLFEGGPVTFPAYASATAGVRALSMTDQFIEFLYKDEPGLLRSLKARAHDLRTSDDDAAPRTSSTDAATQQHPAPLPHPGTPQPVAALRVRDFKKKE